MQACSAGEIVLHELSIAQNLADLALESIREAEIQEKTCLPAVKELKLKLGKFAGVDKHSLLFCFEAVTRGTLLDKAALVIEEIPLVIYCRECELELAVEEFQGFFCSSCGGTASEIRKGKELELVSILFRED